jgi:hypothetical protein
LSGAPDVISTTLWEVMGSNPAPDTEFFWQTPLPLKSRKDHAGL